MWYFMEIGSIENADPVFLGEEGKLLSILSVAEFPQKR